MNDKDCFAENNLGNNIKGSHCFIIARKTKIHRNFDNIEYYEFWSPEGWSVYTKSKSFSTLKEAREATKRIDFDFNYVYIIIEEDEDGFTLMEYKV